MDPVLHPAQEGVHQVGAAVLQVQVSTSPVPHLLPRRQAVGQGKQLGDCSRSQARVDLLQFRQAGWVAEPPGICRRPRPGLQIQPGIVGLRIHRMSADNVTAVSSFGIPLLECVHFSARAKSFPQRADSENICRGNAKFCSWYLLLIIKFLNQFHQLVHQLVLGYLFSILPWRKSKTLSIAAACNAESAAEASPGPLTTQPITATVMGLVQPSRRPPPPGQRDQDRCGSGRRWGRK